MAIEQRINYYLNRYPRVKRVIKSVYQHVMYAVSPKIPYEGNVTRISPGDDDYEYFFGYYDKSPWDATNRYVLCMRATNTWEDVSPREKADILLIDTGVSEDNSRRVKVLAQTSTWNVQQGCRLQWLGPDYASRIIFNDCRENKLVSVVININSGEEQILPAPVYDVSSDGSTALTLDFSRLYNLRPGYGYYNIPETTEGIGLPDSSAICLIDICSGEVTPLLSYKDIAYFQPSQEMQNAKAIHKVNHIMINPAGNRFMFLHRWFIGNRKYTRLLTSDIDGSDMYVLSNDDMVSHCFWKDNNHILAFENKKSFGQGYYLMTDRTQEYRRCWPKLVCDGHPSYSPDKSHIVTDTYPDRARMQRLMIMDNEDSEPVTLASLLSPFKYDNDTRCDLHPRWSRDGNKICFDSVFEGHRGLYSVEVSKDSDRTDTNKLISVIIPVYNTEEYLDRCVKSVTTQTYSNLEIILVNDGSTDGSLDKCYQLQRQHPRLVVINKENGGLGSARNAGLRVAHGDYLAFLDSDDWIAPDCYEYMLKLAQANDADVSDIMVLQVRDERIIGQKTKEKLTVLNGDQQLVHYLHRGMSETNGAPYSVCRKLYKRSLFNDDTAQFCEGTVNEDICFNYRILRKSSKTVVSNLVKYYYFQNESSITSGRLKSRDLALIQVTDELVCLAEETDNQKAIELARMKKARSDFSLLARAAKYGIDSQSVGNAKKLTNDLTRRLRHNLPLLLKSPMSPMRKALAVGFCLNYKLCCEAIRKL